MHSLTSRFSYSCCSLSICLKPFAFHTLLHGHFTTSPLRPHLRSQLAYFLRAHDLPLPGDADSFTSATLARGLYKPFFLFLLPLSFLLFSTINPAPDDWTSNHASRHPHLHARNARALEEVFDRALPGMSTARGLAWSASRCCVSISLSPSVGASSASPLDLHLQVD